MINSGIQIFSVRFGFSNITLLQNGAAAILVDTGLKGHFRHIEQFLKEKNLHREAIKLIVLTHTHYDHAGNVHELAAYTGAKVLVHKNEFENLQNGFTPIPRGMGFYTKFVSKAGQLFYPKYASPPRFEASFINEDEFDLSAFGFDGKVISTPGHTAGSQSILLDKKLIAGDTFINIKNGIIFPPFCNNPKMLLETWQNLFDLGIEEIFPGHGKPFKVEKAVEEFERLRKKMNTIK